MQPNQALSFFLMHLIVCKPKHWARRAMEPLALPHTARQWATTPGMQVVGRRQLMGTQKSPAILTVL